MRLKNLTFCTSALSVAVLLGGCGQTPPLESSAAVTVTDAATLPPPALSDEIGPSREFLIGPEDRLRVDVWGVADLSREVQVDAAGSIALPLAGSLVAAGRTAEELSQDLRERLVRYVKDPLVTVSVTEALSRTLAVQGSVEKPGIYPVTNRMTLVRAIATAGGESALANPQDVVIFRTVQGRRMAALYNLGAIERGNYDDPTVYPNDVIIVGESGRKRLLEDVFQIGPALVTPIIYLLSQ